MTSTPRTSRNMQDAATTPHRRSQIELLDQLNTLFDNYLPSGSRPTSPLIPTLGDAPSPTPDQPRTAPLRLLPDLLAAFEQKRGVQLLTFEEKMQLRGMVEALPEGMEDQPFGVEQVLQLLVNMGVAGSGTSEDVSGSTTPAGDPPALTDQPPPRIDPTFLATAEGSPVARHRRLPSSASTSQIPIPSSSSASLLSASAATAASRRRSLMSSLSRASPSSSKSLRKKRTFEDLSAMVVAQGGTYLGVELVGPMGEGWDASAVAARVREAMGSKGPARERNLVASLTPLTFPQLKALDKAYAAGTAQGLGKGKTLLETVSAEKAFKGNVEFALRGLLMGPLAWDVWLLQKALDSATVNETLLIDLFIGRPPSALTLLRAAYTHRLSDRNFSSATASPSSASTTRSLDVAILSAFSANVRLRKAWEVALRGRWEDCDGDEEGDEGEASAPTSPVSKEEREERKARLLKEDLDQLKVALRRGGNIEIVSKILLARSPTHMHALVIEYRKSTAGHSTLTKAIKQCIPSGTLQKLFLHAVENAKNVGEGKAAGAGVGVWRDAKLLEKAMEADKGGRREELVWRLIRAHCDRPRFLAVQQAYKTKYRKTLGDRLESALPSGVLRDLASGLVASAALPEPQPSEAEVGQVDDPAGPDSLRARTTSSTSLLSVDSALSEKADDRSSDGEGRSGTEAAELEAEGELSDPPSPRSPPTAMKATADDGADQFVEDSRASPDASLFSPTEAGPQTPGMPFAADSPDQSRSTSALSHRSDGHRPSSSLSYRQRSTPLESHQPPSSAGGSADSSKLSSSLRHARPIAPSRAKRRQSEEIARKERQASEEPLSPTEGRVLSPTPSATSRASLSRSASSTGDISLGSSTGSVGSASISIGNGGRRSSLAPSDSAFGSPPSSIDTTSFFTTPLSPIRDESRPSSSFFPDQLATPPPASPPAFDPSAARSDFFATAGATPDPPERFFTAMRRDPSNASSAASSSRPASLFGEGGLDTLLTTGSPAAQAMERTTSEQFQQLVRHAQDLARKLKENEARFQASAAAYEQEVSDLEAQIEEVRAELQTKRREEKELRSVEKEHLQQISSLEADITKLTKSLERSREAYDSMKRNYTATCEEAERLRALVAETRRENRAAEEAIQNHGLQIQQFERDRELLQQAVNKLEEDLVVARRAQDSLDEQKQENLLLKETIDKLRFEIEEMRVVGRKSGFLDNSSALASPAKASLGDSINRSLGREIATQLSEQDSESSDEEGTAGEEDVDDIIITTHRRIKKRGKKSSPLSEPVVTHVETSVSVSDADVQTDTPAMRESDVQTNLVAVQDDLVKASDVKPQIVEVPPPPPPARTEREMQEELAKGLGIKVEAIKQFVEAQKGATKTSGVPVMADVRPSRPGRWRSRFTPGPIVQTPAYLINVFPTSARPYVAQVLDSGVSLFLYTFTIYLIGMISGSRFLPLTHRHTLEIFSPHDTLAWEGLAVGNMGDSGMAPEGIASLLHNIVWSGIRTARRVPL
ncbi:hypothetical protein NBRC10512_007324 [Rhodotorula toruloides]|uniref:RHTO0S01e10946g1_1 n=2 Tax=Rhodotorula toruloides TaxID=5286 RepID=A0A061AMP1_RHOTO|nr:Annexin family protein [Rhodotorula toruloides NP11]EMS24591.1 Annexin family protein [Rhodotorula toruloides NP11]CDR35956.1 RHTO0S01e10946g1_1 [Rhodotorula toruloides]